ncbi:MAG: hypothetical protein KF780_07595 [Sphingomonas sp.]|nr:hypothetical protein [Sphingomonas sp.]
MPLRSRRDGWTPERQTDFIRVLAECGCVRDACRRVGMSPESAYALARRPEAQSFRYAWDNALDNAVRRISDEAFNRCIHGVAVPHFYKGEQVGEHRRYNDGLAMFLMRYRDPGRYGRHLDRVARAGNPERIALDLRDLLAWVRSDALNEEAGRPRLTFDNIPDPDDDDGWEDFRHFRKPGDGDDLDADDPFGEEDRPECARVAEGAPLPDGASGSSTSDPNLPRRAEEP